MLNIIMVILVNNWNRTYQLLYVSTMGIMKENREYNENNGENSEYNEYGDVFGYINIVIIDLIVLTNVNHYIIVLQW